MFWLILTSPILLLVDCTKSFPSSEAFLWDPTPAEVISYTVSVWM